MQSCHANSFTTNTFLCFLVTMMTSRLSLSPLSIPLPQNFHFNVGGFFTLAIVQFPSHSHREASLENEEHQKGTISILHHHNALNGLKGIFHSARGQ